MLSRAENESRNNDWGLPFEIAFEKLDMSLTNIQQEYPNSCLPNQFKKPSGTKAKQLSFEIINPETYDAHARMVAFRIERERLEHWIKALHILYYDHYGKADTFTVNWYDEPNEWDMEDNKSICIDLVKHQQLLYKITLFINTGVIQAQGHYHETFTTSDFPVLKLLVNSICKSKGDTDTDNSETEVKSIETSNSETEVKDSETSNSETLIKNIETSNTSPKKNGNVESSGETCNNCTTPKYRTDDTSCSLQQPKDLNLLQNAFTDALSIMNKSQTGLLQQLGDSFCKAIETSLQPLVDSLKQQLLAVQQLNENISKKERKGDTQVEVKKLQEHVKQLQTVNTSLQTEKFETAIEISKLQSQLETDRMKRESTHIKLETNIRSLTEDNEKLREKLCQQKGEFENLMTDYKLLTEKCDSQFEENLSLKSQLSSSFGIISQKEVAPDDIIMTYKKPNEDLKETTSNQEPKKPTALLLGTSNISGIRPEKLSQYVDVTKDTAYTLDEATSKIEMSETRPDVILLHTFTNDIKALTPEECLEKLEKITNLISTKWNNTKTIVSLTTPRMDKEIHRINSEILDGLIKRKYLTNSRKEVLISENTNLWHSSNQILKPDRYHLSDQGTSMLAANLKNTLHSSLGIIQPQRNMSTPKIQRRRTNQQYNFYGRNAFSGNGGSRRGRGYHY